MNIIVKTVPVAFNLRDYVQTVSVEVGEITDQVLAGGGVIAYYENDGVLESMPYFGGSETMTHSIAPNKFTVKKQFQGVEVRLNSVVDDPPVIIDRQLDIRNYRLVIIPGGVAKSAPGTGANAVVSYSIQELSAMSYK